MMSKKSGAVLERETSAAQQSDLTIGRGGSTHQQTVRNIGLIVGYEFMKYVRRRSFIIVTILMLVLVILGACVPTVIGYFASTSSSQTKLMVTNNAGTIAEMNSDALSRYINASLNGTATSTSSTNSSGKPPYSISVASTGSSIRNLQQQVKDGTISILLVFDRSANGDLSFTYYTNTSGSVLSSDPHLSGIQALSGQLNVLDRASRLGLTPAQTTSLFAPPAFSAIDTGQSGRSVAEAATGYVLAYVGILLIFMSVYMYGYAVATGVAEEKSSRIMEILVNAATPFQLMVGKVVGIGAAGLAQMAAFVVVGIGTLLLQTPLQSLLFGGGSGGLNLNITGASISMLLLLLLYFLLGFLLYATLFAAMGALIKRQEELQNIVQPVMWLFLIGYLVSFVGFANPDAAWVKVISYIPFWTPTTMLMRIGMGNVAWWEIVLTVVLMLAAIYLCAVISARIYRFGVLMYGQKPGFRQLIKLVSKA